MRYGMFTIDMRYKKTIPVKKAQAAVLAAHTYRKRRMIQDSDIPAKPPSSKKRLLAPATAKSGMGKIRN